MGLKKKLQMSFLGGESKGGHEPNFTLPKILKRGPAVLGELLTQR